ncbi:uncharacterized protein LOC112542475 isoform X1 [Python bivittatus]|uniref:Uncharacterized protein LOC112542475 isoform X1 n=1 Tax=Python bivittatus TaxID=176946 RepID=A0A9F5N4H8_PYTBI|nr:uncharacterized protein LOC112542475 isoform X1 [Python bivittatus]
MPKPWLVLMLVGPAAALMLSTPLAPISVFRGKTALLSASFNFSSSVPNYFQIRWRFITGPWLVLIVKADNCGGDHGTYHWWDACEITVEKAERYRHRAEWSSEDASLILQDVRVEDSGVYSIKLLALGVRLSANINLTVINETSSVQSNAAAFGDRRRGTSPNETANTAADVAAPVSLVKAALGRDYTVPNIIQLSLAGLILCLLGLIIAENVASSYCTQ